MDVFKNLGPILNTSRLRARILEPNITSRDKMGLFYKGLVQPKKESFLSSNVVCAIETESWAKLFKITI